MLNRTRLSKIREDERICFEDMSVRQLFNALETVQSTIETFPECYRVLGKQVLELYWTGEMKDLAYALNRIQATVEHGCASGESPLLYEHEIREFFICFMDEIFSYIYDCNLAIVIKDGCHIEATWTVIEDINYRFIDTIKENLSKDTFEFDSINRLSEILYSVKNVVNDILASNERLVDNRSYFIKSLYPIIKNKLIDIGIEPKVKEIRYISELLAEEYLQKK